MRKTLRLTLDVTYDIPDDEPNLPEELSVLEYNVQALGSQFDVILEDANSSVVTTEPRLEWLS